MPPTQGKQYCPLPTALAASPTFSFSSPAMAPASQTSKWSSSTPSLGFPFHGSNLGTLWIHFWFYPPERFESSPCYQTTQGKQTVLCQQHWQLHQLSASRLLQWPHHPTPQNEVLLPHLWFPFSWLKLGNPLNSFLILSTGKIWKFTLLPNLACHQHRENNTVLCQQHWQLHQLSASRLRQSPQHHKPQNEVLLPHLWASLFVAQTWEPFKFIPDFIHRKNLKVHPVTKLDMPPTQGKQTVLCHQHWERKLRKTDADLEPFFSISGTCGCWLGILLILFLEPHFYFCKSLCWMTDDFLFAQHVGLNPPDFIFAIWVQ